MKMFSVYDYDRKRYVYYRGPGPRGTHAGSPRVRAKDRVGATPEQASWSLPFGAVKVGEGELPRGRIASYPAAVIALGDLTSSPTTLGILAGVAYLAWKAFR